MRDVPGGQRPGGGEHEKERDDSNNHMLTQEQVFEWLQKEAEYATGWAKGDRKVSKIAGISDSDVHSLEPLAGQPFSIYDYMAFAQKYWDEAILAGSNYTPDGGSIRIRIAKIASLLVRALQVHGRLSDLTRLAGISSSEFPILSGGIKTFDKLSSEEGCLLPSSETKRLRNESPSCDPLRK